MTSLRGFAPGSRGRSIKLYTPGGNDYKYKTMYCVLAHGMSNPTTKIDNFAGGGSKLPALLLNYCPDGQHTVKLCLTLRISTTQHSLSSDRHRPCPTLHCV